ncbi:hypothetical protein GGF44_005961 [Coemansia sp. RSA 1694]|nr:hypothetical protein GGF44_005961 [Coemansia sp. RSA 1694]
MYNAASASLRGHWRILQLVSLALVLLNSIAIVAAAADIAAIILPLASTVWTPGKTATITYRISGSPDSTSYEIDLMTGEPDNAQLVHVFDKMAVPTASGVNSVTVQVPATLPEGKYGLRLGPPNGSVWKYSQLFAISNTAQSSGHVPNITAPSTSTATSTNMSKAKDIVESKSRSPSTSNSSLDQGATSAATKPALANIAPRHLRLAGLPALALAIVVAAF